MCRVDITLKHRISHPDLSNYKLKLLHYNLEHKDKLIACVYPSCDKAFILHQEMQAHYKREHLGERIHCGYCSTSYVWHRSFNIHMDEKHPEKSEFPLRFLCPRFGCGAAYSSSANLRVHIYNKHYKYNKPDQTAEKCPICQKSFSNLKDHIAFMHETPKLIPCSLCGGLYRSETELKAHLRKTHAGRSMSLPCRVCGKVVSSRRMQEHVRAVHEKVRNFCSQCEKKLLQLYGFA